MSTQTLSSVATHIVGQYSQVGKLIVGTYRTGAQRFVSGANTRYAAFVNGGSLPLVNAGVKASLIDVQKQFAGLLEGGIASGSKRAEQAIDLLAGGVSGGIQRVATAAGRVQSPLVTGAITTVGGLTMPVAQISLAIANRAVEGTKRLSARVIGAEAEAVKTAGATTKRTVKKAVRRVKARA